MKAKDKASIGEDGEEKREELAELLSRARVGDVFASAVYGSQIDGATKELQDHLGVPGNVSDRGVSPERRWAAAWIFREEKD